MIKVYQNNIEPKIGDKVKNSDGDTIWIVETVGGGRLGNKVGARSNSSGQFRELYYYCWSKVN
jgi:hypothetical protein